MSQTVEPQLIAFLDVVTLEDKATLRGGTLITDLDTKPYEFRCTGPVQPSSLQRILYGATLDDYVYVDLLGGPLLRAAKEKPMLVMVQNELLLRVRPTVGYPVVLLERIKKATASSRNGGLLVRVHPSFSDELDAVHATLDPLLEKRDLLEPFERLRVALEEAHRRGIGKK